VHSVVIQYFNRNNYASVNISFDNGTNWTPGLGIEMIPMPAYPGWFTLTIRSWTNSLNMCFNDGTNWDNNGGSNYTTTLTNFWLSNGTYSASAPADFPAFLGVNGTSFSGGFKFIGVNIDPWRFITSSGEVYSQADILSWVQNAVAMCGASVIRMHINGGSFEPTIGNYNEAPFKQLDYLIAACRQCDIYCLIALRDYLSSPFPASAYDPYWYIGGGTNLDNILTNSTAIADYKNFISYVLNRSNTVTGTAYKNEKCIMGWELINEPNFIYGAIGGWITNIGNYVKSIDPNHLNSVGIAAAESQWWDAGAYNWTTLGNLDFIDLHYYAPEGLYNPVDASNVVNLEVRVSNGLALNKPVVIGEFGCVTTNSAKTMSNLYQTVVSVSYSSGASGCLVYAWGPPGPNGWGGTGSFDIYTNYPDLCS
jgi:hypothetical protein